MTILAVVEGALRVNDGDESTALSAGGFCLIPACCGNAVAQSAAAVASGLRPDPGHRGDAVAQAVGDVAFLQVQLG